MRRPSALLLLLVLAAPLSARAAEFDARGVLTLDPKAAVALDFDSGTAARGVSYETSETALQGAGYAVVSSRSFNGSSLPLTFPASKGAYTASVWARANRLMATIDVEYADGGGPGLEATFYPTGRVTSDGWYELATNRFMVDGTRKPATSLGVRASGADMDALEIVESGAFAEPLACEGRGEGVCGDGAFCAAGWCRNGDAMVPPLPGAFDRTKLSQFLGWRLRAFFGGRHTREHTLPKALAVIRAMPAAKSAWAFWNGWATALHTLRDWHTSISGNVDVAGRGAFPVCVDEGDADLSHDQAPATPGLADVLVTIVGPQQNSGLKPGDRIVAIDGKHPIEWAESFDNLWWGAWHSDDPNGHAEALENLRIQIRRWAKELTIIRCDAAAGTCGAPETLPVSSLPTTEPEVYPYCDHRPKYHLASGGRDPLTHYPMQTDNVEVTVGPIVENGPDEAIYTVVWDDVMIWDPRQNPYAAPMNTLRTKASGAILDHRTGNGGTEPAAEYLTQLFRTPALLGASSGFNGTVGLFDAPFSSEAGLGIVGARASSDDGYSVGSSSPKDMRVAVLLARDGSASDWWPEGMKGAGPNVRLFGRRTAGAFSSFLSFDYFGGLTWKFASGDFVRADGSTHIGEGVLPDEDLVPKQSDLVAGKDTVYLRALEWVRTGR